MNRSTALLCGAVLLTAPGCGERAQELSERQQELLSETRRVASEIGDRGRELLENGRQAQPEADWSLVIDRIEAQGLRIRELADLYAERRWREAEAWVEDVDGEATKAAFRTIGRVLLLEHREGTGPCLAEIDRILGEEQPAPVERTTLEIMRGYMERKGETKSLELAIRIAAVFLFASSGDPQTVGHAGMLAIDALRIAGYSPGEE